MLKLRDTTKQVLTYPLFFLCSLTSALYLPYIFLMPLHISKFFGVANFVETSIMSPAVAHTVVTILVTVFNVSKYGHWLFLVSVAGVAVVFSLIVLFLVVATGNVAKYLYIACLAVVGGLYGLFYASGMPIALKVYGANGSSFMFGYLGALTGYTYFFDYFKDVVDFDNKKQALLFFALVHAFPVILSVLLSLILYYLIRVKFLEPVVKGDDAVKGSLLAGLKRSLPSVFLPGLSIAIELLFYPSLVPFSFKFDLDDAITILRYDALYTSISSIFCVVFSHFSQNNITPSTTEKLKYRFGVDSTFFYYFNLFLTFTRFLLLLPAYFHDKEKDLTVFASYMKYGAIYNGMIYGYAVGLGFDGVLKLNVTSTKLGGSGDESFETNLADGLKAVEFTSIVWSCSITLATIVMKVYFTLVKK